MLGDERLQQIIELVSRRGEMSYEELVEALGVSPSTVRRDVLALSSNGSLLRVRGGAKANVSRSRNDRIAGRAFHVEDTARTARKRRIAKAASALIEDGQTVIVSNGTTTFRLVEFLADRDVQVVTYSLPVLNALQDALCGVIVTGGHFYRDQGAFLTTDDAGTPDFAAALFFVGAHSVDEAGSRELDPLLVSVERRMLSRATKTVLLADSSKFRMPGGLLSLRWNDVDTVVTDADIPNATRAMLEERGVTVIVA